jgi:hypothetical protein
MATPATIRRSLHKWIVNSSALLYITNQLSLFKRILKKKARSSFILNIGEIKLRIKGVNKVRI